MSYQFDQYYQCGNKKFHNIFKAFDHQKQTGHFPKLILDEDLIKKLQNRKKPRDISPEAIRNLIVNRLRDLRKKYNKLKIAYSGGTDSYTILRLCLDNDIYVDETITIMSSLYGNVRVDLEYLAGLRLAKKHEGTGIGKCVEIKPTSNDLTHVNDPDWFLDERFVRGPYLPFRPYCLAEVIKKNVAGGDTVVLTGLEKSKFIIESGKPNWFVDDSAGELMGLENTVPVFLDKENPDLVVSLAYASLEFMERIEEGRYFGYNTVDPRTKLKMLDRFGFFKTPFNFVNVAKLGKTKFNMNTKTRYFFKELQKNGHGAYIQKIYETHKNIKQRFLDLPHALEFEGKLTKPIGRLSQKIPILQHKFAS